MPSKKKVTRKKAAKKKPLKKPRLPAITPALKSQLPKELPVMVKSALAECTPTQQRFIVKYCGEARGNGALAAKLAGVGRSGGYMMYASRASQMLKEPKVRMAVDAWMTAYAMSAAELTYMLGDLARCNVGPFVELQKNGTLKVKLQNSGVWEAYQHWVKSVEADPKTGRVTRIHLHDPLAAMRELAKIMKLYSDAPIFNFYLLLQQMRDEELLAELEEQKRLVAGK